VRLFRCKKRLPWKELARKYWRLHKEHEKCPVKIVHAVVDIDTIPHIDLAEQRVFDGRRKYRVAVRFFDGRVVELTATEYVGGRVLSPEETRNLLKKSTTTIGSR